MKKLNRREFAKSLAIAPVGLAAGNSLLGIAHSQAAPAQSANPPATKAPKTEAEYNRHPPVVETEPFAAPLTFAPNAIEPKLQLFALRDVTLEAGPIQQARDWNRAYMLRLPNDRLLHNFRINAGLPSSAMPLGGWEDPKCELRGHFVGHYLSACALHYAATGDTAIKAKADELVAGIAECQAKLNLNGYISAFPTELFDRLDAATEGLGSVLHPAQDHGRPSRHENPGRQRSGPRHPRQTRRLGRRVDGSKNRSPHAGNFEYRIRRDERGPLQSRCRHRRRPLGEDRRPLHEEDVSSRPWPCGATS